MNYKEEAGLDRKAFWSIIAGNILESYDKSLYICLNLVIAPQFFPSQDRMVSIICGMLLVFIASLIRPFAPIAFGRYALKYGTKNALLMSLYGMSLSTLTFALIPNYYAIGVAAPIILTLARTVQAFCAAGEESVASMFYLRNTKREEFGRSTAKFVSSTVFGGNLLASFAALLVGFSGHAQTLWRIPFLIGFCGSLVAIFLRRYIHDHLKPALSNPKSKNFDIIKANPLKTLGSMLIGIFDYTVHSIPYSFMINIYAVIGHGSIENVLLFNFLMTWPNLLSCLVVGRLCDKFGAKKVLVSVLAGYIALTVPLLLAVTVWPSSFVLVTILFAIVCSGYAVGIHTWLSARYMENAQSYFYMSFGFTCGAQLGKLVPPLAIWLWNKTIPQGLLCSSLFCSLAIVAMISIILINKTHKMDLDAPKDT